MRGLVAMFVVVSLMLVVMPFVGMDLVFRAVGPGICSGLRVAFESVGRTQCFRLPGASSAP